MVVSVSPGAAEFIEATEEIVTDVGRHGRSVVAVFSKSFVISRAPSESVVDNAAKFDCRSTLRVTAAWAMGLVAQIAMHAIKAAATADGNRRERTNKPAMPTNAIIRQLAGSGTFADLSRATNEPLPFAAS